MRIYVSETTRIVAAGIALVFLVGGLVLVLIWAINQNSEMKQNCKDAGGKVYHRTVGKMTYYKCFTDDDKVIQL